MRSHRLLQPLQLATLVTVFVMTSVPVAIVYADTFSVNNTADSVDAAARAACRTGGQGCTLRAAIKEVNDRGPKDSHTIYLRVYDYALNIRNSPTVPDENNGDTGDLDITGNVTLIGAGTIRDTSLEPILMPTVIDASGIDDRVIDVWPDATVVLMGMIIKGGKLEGQGAGIRNAGDLKLINVHVRENTTKQANGGGGIYNHGPVLTVEHRTGGAQYRRSLRHVAVGRLGRRDFERPRRCDG